MTIEAEWPGADRSGRWRSLIAMFTFMVGVSLSIGMTVPLLSLVMERRGVDDATIGLNAAMSMLALILSGPLLPPLLRRLGSGRAIVGGVVAHAVVLMAFAFTDDLAAWFVLRFVMGSVGGLPWMAADSWVNAAADEASRGRIVSLYATAATVGFAIGPALLLVTGTEGLLPFAVAAGAMVAGLLPLAVLRPPPPPSPGQAATPVLAVFRIAPFTILAALTSGFAENAVFAMMPLYGLGLALGPATAALLVSAFGAGGMALQLPLGLLADRIDRRQALILTTALALALTLAIPFLAPAGTVFWGVLFIWGGLVSGFYTLGMIALGERFRADALPSATSAFIMAYTIGGMLGPAAAGLSMVALPPHGFMALLAAAFAAYLAIGLIRLWQTHHHSAQP